MRHIRELALQCDNNAIQDLTQALDEPAPLLKTLVLTSSSSALEAMDSVCPSLPWHLPRPLSSTMVYPPS
jgi:hypothetical protein